MYIRHACIVGIRGLSQGANQFPVGNTNHNTAELNRYHHDISSRYPVGPPQSIHGPTPQVVRGGHSSYPQRAMPPNRVMSSQPHLGYWATSSGDGSYSIPEAHPSRYSRTSSTMGFHSGDRSGRSRSSYDRLRSLSHDGYTHDRRVGEV